MSRQADWLETRAKQTPQTLAFVEGAARLTWAQLLERVHVRTEAWRALGVKRGDVVALRLSAGVGFVEALFCIEQIGATLLPLNLRWTRDEVDYALRDSGARFLVTEDLEPTALSVATNAENNDPPFAVLYTSGTSGRPKGAVLGHENFLASVQATAMHLGASASDRWLACLPLFHVGGLSILIRGVLLGSASVIQARFDPDTVNHALDRDEISHVSLVPQMLERVLHARADRAAPRSLRCVLLGGGPAAVELIERAHKAGFPVHPTYGLTEATSQVATRVMPDASRQARAGLQPLPGVEVRVADAKGPHEVGEICVRGAIVMRGYLNAPEATARTLRDGWLHTGDLGSLDANGDLHVLDRRSDLIISGGENIYPAEIERVLEAHPDIAEAAVTPVADLRFGERPMAWIVPRTRSAPDPAALEAFCRSQLASYKLPVRFQLVAALPRSPAGKLLRRKLRSGA